MTPPANLFHLRRFVPSVCCLVQLFRVFFAQTQNPVEIRFGGRSLQQLSVHADPLTLQLHFDMSALLLPDVLVASVGSHLGVRMRFHKNQ
ncbi:hypothetical protein D1O30_21110 [Methylocystis hirsuta]|uniref:Uncharacterized protein n=1 Tax=Methylocystis hirsuta TaxID=369798 RepID=A0A3M9XJ52_9HYPH|nr:hypothetical protein D1O30_21110 [Methylocystis hirsuta]